LIIYGAASAVGAFAVQWAKGADIGPTLAIVGRGVPFVERLLDKAAGDAPVERQGPY